MRVKTEVNHSYRVFPCTYFLLIGLFNKALLVTRTNWLTSPINTTRDRLLKTDIKEMSKPLTFCSCLSIDVNSFRLIILISSTIKEYRCNYIIFALATKPFSAQVLICNVIWMVLPPILSIIQLVDIEITNFFYLFWSVKPNSKV